MHKQWGLPSLGRVTVLHLEKREPDEFSLADDFLKTEQVPEEKANGFGR